MMKMSNSLAMIPELKIRQEVKLVEYDKRQMIGTDSYQRPLRRRSESDFDGYDRYVICD